MKKILVSAYCAKNFGDDLFLKILFNRYINVEWNINTLDENYKDVFSDCKNIRIIDKMSKIKVEYKSFDGVIFIGGSIFMEKGAWKELYNRRREICILFKEKPIFILGSNFGEFYSEEFIKGYKQLFEMCTDVCFRDNYSYSLFSDLNNVRVEPDIVFQLKNSNIKKVNRSIGISVIDFNIRPELKEYQEIYTSKIIDIIKTSINNNYTITLFSFCEAEGDMMMIRKIINRIDNHYNNYINIEKYEGNIDNFLDKFKCMEMVIGTRFHACVLSQVFEQGLYPIIYSEKTYNVLKDIGLIDYYTEMRDMENINPQFILSIMKKNKIKNEKIHIDSEKQFKILDSYLDRN